MQIRYAPRRLFARAAARSTSTPGSIGEPRGISTRRTRVEIFHWRALPPAAVRRLPIRQTRSTAEQGQRRRRPARSRDCTQRLPGDRQTVEPGD